MRFTQVCSAALVGLIGLAGCSSDSGRSLEESCVTMRSEGRSLASPPESFMTRTADLYDRLARSGDTETKQLLEPAARAMRSLAAGGRYDTATRDAIMAVDVACSRLRDQP